MADTRVADPTCANVRRPEALVAGPTTVHGLRAAQARLDGQTRYLDVWLFRDPPPSLVNKSRWRVRAPAGGAPVAVTDASVESAPTPHVRLTLGGLPDTAQYRLEVDPPGTIAFDPLRTWLPVRLRPECPDLGTCFEPVPPPPAVRPSPVHDYTARDWASLRRVLLEYLVRRDPDADLSLADPAITLLELFAHVGDVLHYRLDRVATEAYLETARRRTSVRRHARLVDYRFSDGVSATTFVHVSVSPGANAVSVRPGDVAATAPGSPLAFTIEKRSPDAKDTDPVLVARDALGEIPIYDWGEAQCCLPAGATECVLVRPLVADAAPLGNDWLKAGDYLAFEVVDALDADRHTRWARRDPASGPPDYRWPRVDASGKPGFREPLPGRPSQVVELIAVERIDDPLAGPLSGRPLELARVRWREEDALRASYPVTIDAASGLPEVAVARGNVVRAHHGRLVDGAPGTTLAPRRPEDADPSSFEPIEYELVACGRASGNGRPGGPGLALRPDGRPHRLGVEVTLPSGIGERPPVLTTLLEAAPGELAAVVDVEEHEPPLLRFKTGAVGIAPPPGTHATIHAAYEVSCGAVGNVAANALVVLERNKSGPRSAPEWDRVPGSYTVRNPAAAFGGEDPTPLDAVRRDAPEAFAAVAKRAVLPADHAALAATERGVQRAAAVRSWTGAWPLVTTLVDLEVDDREATLAKLQTTLDASRVLGTEARVTEGRAVGILLALEICAVPGVDPELVRQQALAALRPGADDRPGVFHPARLLLGADVYPSAAVAAVSSLPYVDAVTVLEARRLDDPGGTVRSVIPIAPDEVAALDDDPVRPERGRLDVRVRGGR